MSLTTLLFGFAGRINRAKYWLASLIYVVASIAFTIIAVMLIGGADLSNLLSIAGAGLSVWALGLVFLAGIVWSSLAVIVKRLHDRDKSGWWVLVFWFGPSCLGGLQATAPPGATATALGLASIAVTIWAFVELGCLRGTAGPNRYGPDPLDSAPVALR